MKNEPNLHALNLHHLRYFWAVATSGNLTQTAAVLRVAQSALSAQIRQLEEALGRALFVREGRRLTLTETGQLVLRHADALFAQAEELLVTLRAGQRASAPLRVGTVATLSRNFQEAFLAPLTRNRSSRLRIESGRFEDLLQQLARHELDLVLANQPATRSTERKLRSRRIAKQPVALVGKPRKTPVNLVRALREMPLLVPGRESHVRTEFEAWCEQAGFAPTIHIEADDMAMMRLLAKNTDYPAVLPTIVVRDEIRGALLQEWGVIPDLFETFYGITAVREYQHPLVATLLDQTEAEVLKPTRTRSRGLGKAKRA